MVSWGTFAEAAPEIAGPARERFGATGLVLVGTLRKDGSPRISPVEPLVLDGELYLGMMWRSQKALDLLRDPRCVVHSVVCNKDGSEGDSKLYGRVVDVPNPETRERVAQASFDATGWRPEEPYHLFTLDIESAGYIRFEDGKQTTRRWPVR